MVPKKIPIPTQTGEVISIRQQGRLKVIDRDTVGYRIKEARLNAGLSQQDLATRVDLGRSAVAQWERNESTPSVSLMQELGRILETPPEFLSFGLRTRMDQPEDSTEALGIAVVSEIEFGISSDDMEAVSSWGLPVGWLRGELGVKDVEKVIVYRTHLPIGAHPAGSFLIVNTADYRPSPPGDFLYWDGVGPSVATLKVVPSAGKKVSVNVLSGGDEYTVTADQISVIGRIIAAVSK